MKKNRDQGRTLLDELKKKQNPIASAVSKSLEQKLKGIQQHIDDTDGIADGEESSRANEKTQKGATVFCDLIEKDIKVAKGL